MVAGQGKIRKASKSDANHWKCRKGAPVEAFGPRAAKRALLFSDSPPLTRRGTCHPRFTFVVPLRWGHAISRPDLPRRSCIRKQIPQSTSNGQYAQYHI